MNQAVAVSFAQNPVTALGMLLELEDDLNNYQPQYAAKADMFRRLGRHDEATTAYLQAIELSHNDAERRFLEKRLKGLGAD